MNDPKRAAGPWFYLAGTAAATLAFKHYLIDLVVALPFVFCAAKVGLGKNRIAITYFMMVLLWLVLIRSSTPMLIAHPWGLRILVLGTIFLSIPKMHLRPFPILREESHSFCPVSTVVDI